MALPEEKSIAIWVDAQLSPAIAKWLQEDFGVNAASLRALGLLFATDEVVFMRAKEEKNVIILTKDIDLVNLQEKWGQPPKIIHLTCGNTSNRVVRQILQKHFTVVMNVLVENNEPIIEITD